MKKYFGEKLYFVHDDLNIIVEGHPLIKFNPELSHCGKKVKNKFGTIWGQWAQFGLYDISGKEPELKVCVYWDGNNCFSTKKEAVAVLTKIFEKRIKGEQEDKINLQGQIEDLHEVIKDINQNIKDIQKQIKKLNANSIR